MIDLGTGAPIVLVPGIQGRWEWARAAVEALGRGHRVITFSLCDEPASGFSWDPAAGFDNYVSQVAAAMDQAGLPAAAIVGVSYGGLVAAEFAARHPSRTSALVLASALSPGWMPDRRVRFYLRAPRLLAPLFMVTAPLRLYAEVAAALPGLDERLRFICRHVWRVARAPFSPSRMARRVRWATAHRFAGAHAIVAPTLIVTGEPRLDGVVPVAQSLRIREPLPAARHVVLERTGHLGLVTRAGAFASIVGGFADQFVQVAPPAAPQERQRAS